MVGASAGGVEALKSIAAGLPESLPAAVFCTVHVAPTGPRLLPSILDFPGGMPTKYGRDGEEIVRGRMYLAPPDHHLLLRRGSVQVTRGPRENRHRPAVDPLFRSAAVAYGPRVIGVVLTGNLDDGTRGLSAVKRCGGLAVVQDPDDALYPSMPSSALRNTPVDHIATLADLPALLRRLVCEPPAPPASPPSRVEVEAGMSERETDESALLDRVGHRSALTCPECHGALWELEDGNLLNFRCHVGHAFSSNALLMDHSKELEASLWAAVRGFEESATIADRIAERRAEDSVGDEFVARARAAREHAQRLRELIDQLPVTAE